MPQTQVEVAIAHGWRSNAPNDRFGLQDLYAVRIGNGATRGYFVEYSPADTEWSKIQSTDRPIDGFDTSRTPEDYAALWQQTYGYLGDMLGHTGGGEIAPPSHVEKLRGDFPNWFESLAPS